MSLRPDMREIESLLLFTKVPCPGRVKTRLCPPLRPEEAAALQGAFVADVATQAGLLQAARPGLDVQLAAAPFGEAGPLAVHGLPLLAQEGEGLGARMAAAIAGRFAAGAGRVVLRGTDSPLVPIARLHEAFDALAAPGVDVVLGPDRGGGYYLIGTGAPCPALFAEMPLGSATEGGSIFERTLARSAELGLACVVLRAESDVDVPPDLVHLARELARAPAAAPATAALLRQLPRVQAFLTRAPRSAGDDIT